MSAVLPAPFTEDPDTGGFWRAAAQGGIGVQYCVACDRPLHLPRAFCSRCGTWDTEWRTVEPRGHVYSFTVVEHQVHPAFEVPHTLVLVELAAEPEVRLLGHLPGRPAVRIGTALTAVFDDYRLGTVVPRWTLADPEANRTGPGHRRG